MNEATRKKVPAYFRSLRFPGWLFVVAVVGIVTLVFASGLWKLSGASILIGAAGVGYRFLANSPSDAEIDAMVDADITALKVRALERCHLEQDETVRDSKVIIGFPFRNFFRGAQRVFGKSRKTR
jgi:hypothetical protein